MYLWPCIHVPCSYGKLCPSPIPSPTYKKWQQLSRCFLSSSRNEAGSLLELTLSHGTGHNIQQYSIEGPETGHNYQMLPNTTCTVAHCTGCIAAQEKQRCEIRDVELGRGRILDWVKMFCRFFDNY